MTETVECPVCNGIGEFMLSTCPLCGGETIISVELDGAFRLATYGRGSEALTTITLYDRVPNLFSPRAKERMRELVGPE